MTRILIPLLVCAALSAGDAAGHRKHLGAVLGSQTIDAGHVLEARAVAGQTGLVLIRWGDVGNAIAKGAGKGAAMAWSGSVTGTGVSLVREIAFEDGSRARRPEVKAGARPRAADGPGDRLIDNGSGGTVSWDTRTSSAWDGVVVRAASGSTLQIASGSAHLTITVP